MLCAIEKFPAAEVGEILDIAETEVEARVQRALRLLCRSLSHELNRVQKEAFASDAEQGDRIVRKVTASISDDGRSELNVAVVEQAPDAVIATDGAGAV